MFRLPVIVGMYIVSPSPSSGARPADDDDDGPVISRLKAPTSPEGHLE